MTRSNSVPRSTGAEPVAASPLRDHARSASEAAAPRRTPPAARPCTKRRREAIGNASAELERENEFLFIRESGVIPWGGHDATTAAERRALERDIVQTVTRQEGGDRITET